MYKKSIIKYFRTVNKGSKKPFYKKGSPYLIKQAVFIGTVCLIISLVSSCAFITLKNDLETMNKHSIIQGQIKASASDSSAPYIITAFDSNNRIIKYNLIKNKSDYYILQLPKDKVYKISIFKDIDRNSAYSPNEPADYWLNKNGQILYSNDTIIHNFNISEKKIIPKDLRLNPDNTLKINNPEFKVVIGEISNLENEQFSKNYGSIGLWQPFEAFRKYGIGVYFREKYDINKTPVLLIYGMGGFAQSWRPLISKLDKNKFQPWIYQYPSGYSIKSSAKALKVIIKQLKDKYHFKKIYVVGHSMGGLVAAHFIKLINSDPKTSDIVKLIITISTPWAGDKDAEWGQKAPITIPCWNDLVPSSAFIKSLSPSIFKKAPYYLLFTYKGDRKPFRINNDTTISIASQLELNFQLKAKQVIGFNDHHAIVLNDDTAINIIDSILNQTIKK
jgi:pimeloyl-ACP methyl ester carboxylesterase